MATFAGKEISWSIEKIAELGNNLLNLEGHNEWEVDEIRLIRKNSAESENLLCRWEKNELEEWVLKCFKP
jgi:hypothetical protein